MVCVSVTRSFAVRLGLCELDHVLGQRLGQLGLVLLANLLADPQFQACLRRCEGPLASLRRSQGVLGFSSLPRFLDLICASIEVIELSQCVDNLVADEGASCFAESPHAVFS